MTVRSILERKGREVATFGPEASLVEVTRHLAERKIGAVVIMRGDTIAGIFSERDLVRVLAADGAAGLNKSVGAVMTTRVRTCGEDETLEDVMDTMTDGRFRHLPVVDKGRLVGIVSIGDVVKRRIGLAEAETEQLRSYISS